MRMRCDFMKKWINEAVPASLLEQLAEKLHISPATAHVLWNRQIRTAEAGRHFLYDTIDDCGDPFLMQGMEKAVNRILQAVKKKEKIVIYGDYDVDGITSTALLQQVLTALGGVASFYIPERQSEGYGLNREALQQLSRGTADLLITVDCGISSTTLINEFSTRLDIIVTDHHQPPETLPQAVAVLNPKQSGCAYPCKDLAGVGVAFTLARALWQRHFKEALTAFTEIVALGTIADLVPLTGENRILVRHGLERMKKGSNIGIQALITAAGLTASAVSSGCVAFTLAPRLNASGRLSHAERGAALLLEENAEKAAVIAASLSELNRERQQVEHMIAEEAIAQIEAKGQAEDGVLLVYQEGWHSGVIGIAASRLVERYYRPALVITVKDGVGKGSCRSIRNFNMYEALRSADDLLIQYGGHTMAAGFSVRAENIEPLRQRLQVYAAAHLAASDYIPTVAVDWTLPLEDISLALIDELSLLEPYGMANSRPVFASPRCRLAEVRTIGKERNHLRIVAGEKRRVSGVGWSMADRYGDILSGDYAELAFQLERNEFNGSVSPQMILQDIHADAPSVVLNRAVMADIYKEMKGLLAARRRLPLWELERRLITLEDGRYTGHVIKAALQVFRELEILTVHCEKDETYCDLPPIEGKMSLAASATYMQYGSH